MELQGRKESKGEKEHGAPRRKCGSSLTVSVTHSGRFGEGKQAKLS